MWLFLLDSSFRIFVKVLGPDHMSEIANKHMERNIQNQGNIKVPMIHRKACMLRVPDGFVSSIETDKAKTLFNGFCLPIAIIIASLYEFGVLKKLKGMTKKYKKIRGLYNRKNKADVIEQSGWALWKEFSEVCQNIPGLQQVEKQTLKDICPLLGDHYKVNIIIRTTRPHDKIVYRYPEIQRDNWPYIQLHQHIFDDVGIGHLAVIKSPYVYMRHHSMVCIYCSKSLRAKYTRHRCPERPQCRECERWLLKATTYTNSKTRYNYCDSRISRSTKINKLCEKCDMTTTTKSCSLRHQWVCKVSIQCTSTCKRKLRTDGTHEGKAKRLKSHNCEHNWCFTCYSEMPLKHLCKLKSDRPQKGRPKLAFVTLILRDPSPYCCLKCHNLSTVTDMGLCKLHRKSLNENKLMTLQPVYIVIYRESDKFGNFIREEITCDETCLPTGCTGISSPKDFNFEYMPDVSKEMADKPFRRRYNQPPKTCGADDLAKRVNLTLMQKLVKLALLDKSYMNTVLIGQSDWLGYLYEAMQQLDITPDFVLPDNQAIRSINFPYNGCKAIRFSEYMNEPLNVMAKNYKLPLLQSYFPSSFIHPANYKYSGRIPDSDWFVLTTDSVETKTAKEKYVKSIEAEPEHSWTFAYELSEFAAAKAYLFTTVCLRFVLEKVHFQKQLRQHLNMPKEPILQPFHSPIGSLAGLMYGVLQNYCLKHYDVRILKHPVKGIYDGNCSQPERQYSLYLQHCNPENEMRGAYLHPESQFQFTKIPTTAPDVLDMSTNIAYYFHSCVFHGHLDENCPQVPANVNRDTIIPKKGTTYGQENDRFDRIREKLLKLTDVKDVIVMWHCEWNRKKKTQAVQNWLQKHYVPFPNCHRLRGRNAIRGGRVEAAILKWRQSDHVDERLCFKDVVSMYPYVAREMPYPIGDYDVVIGKYLKEMKTDDNKFMYRGKEIMGLALCHVLPPRDMNIPFLSYFVEATKNWTAIVCRTCSETCNVDPCHHSEEKRMFEITAVIEELNFAMSLGYKVVHIHEVYAYNDRAYLFRDVIDVIAHVKLLNSGNKSNDGSTDKAYCDAINEHMKFTGTSLELKPELLQDNPTCAKSAKRASVMLCGKLITRTNHPITKFCSTEEEFMHLMKNHKVLDIVNLSENWLQVMIANEKEDQQSSRFQYCLGAHITAYARIHLQKQIITIESTPGAKFCYADTDSLVYILKRTTLCPLGNGFSLGQLRPQISDCKDIHSWYSLGGKVYYILYTDDKDQLRSICRCRGINLDSHNVSPLVSDQLFNEYVEAAVNQKIRSTKLPQVRKMHDTKTKVPFMKHINQLFSNNIAKKRVVYADCTTRPFGYKETKFTFKKLCPK